MSAAAAAGDTSGSVWAELRLADAGDVPHIHRLIRQMAEFERLTHLFSATEASLASSLFPSPSPPPPFLSFTVLILDLLPHPPQAPQTLKPLPIPPISRRIDLPSPVPDPDAAAFASSRGGGGVVAGFLLCFPNYSTFLAKPGIYVEDIFVRAPWRRRGLGRMMLAAVAAQAARMGMGRVEWCVLDWNAAAIDFYKQMGADVLPMWRICRLAGPALDAYAEAEEEEQPQQEN
ncbi:putative acetyltransferase NATA1-like [Ananas comosus]|uniref:Putative acetyltransferase NATA1-like n=1 Tax=Ananas comosus TaxID=4615 RepID=A0A199W283_ANACO|nr:putative acetyltransferase NATA1-like [Ananas comosus]